MAITQAVCNSFKVEILKGLHNFTATTGNAFKLALYDNEATLSKSTTAFQQTDEVANSGTYSEGGGALTSVTPTLSSDTAVCDFNDMVPVEDIEQIGIGVQQTTCVCIARIEQLPWNAKVDVLLWNDATCSWMRQMSCIRI